MSSTSSEGIDCFVRLLTLHEDRRTANPRLRDQIPNAARVDFDRHARELYSYGRHFPLARYVPAKRGRHAQWLINGDRWGRGGWSLTSRHQSETRESIARAIEDAAKLGQTVISIVIPFSALDGAGIDRDTIRPLDVREDRRESIRNTADIPARYIDRELPSKHACEDHSRAVDPRGEQIGMAETLATSLPITVQSVNTVTGETQTIKRVWELSRQTYYRRHGYIGYMNGIQYGNGWRDENPPLVTLWLDHSHTPTVIANDGETASVEWFTENHLLGDSLFTAARLTTRHVRCPDHNPPDQMKLDGMNWGNERCPTCGHLYGDAGTVTVTIHKRSRFVSSFDYNEPWPLYFLAALPRKSRATTVAMAIEDLAPSAVHAALARGLDVRRQGDIFVIPTPLTDTEVYARAVRRTRLSVWRGNGKPHPGELGHRAPLSARQARAAHRMRHELYASERARQLASTALPTTPAGWRKEKREKLAKLRESIARHENRIADADNVCQCVANYSNADIPCHRCGLPVWYRGYTVDNAMRALANDRESYVEELARARNRDLGYCSRASYREKYGKCYGRALSAWRGAKNTTARRYTPDVPSVLIRSTLAIHGTAHTATEVAVCKRGVTYVRGIMHHEPAITNERRDRDHHPLALDGARWYLAIRNTVPTE